MKNYSLEKYLSLFFHGAPVDEIYCDNEKVIQFMVGITMYVLLVDNYDIEQFTINAFSSVVSSMDAT